MTALEAIQAEVIVCENCPRLRRHCREMAIRKRRAYREHEYWGRPVPAFGDPNARLLIIGLAPGAHGANRTGRMFTGDRSGDFLYRALHETGFASQPHSQDRGDGLTLWDCFITASARCAPPDNKPSPEEVAACRTYLIRELRELKNIKAVVALGRLAFQNYLAVLREFGIVRALSDFEFAHDRSHQPPNSPVLISSYHPSQQNTSTGRLTAEMLRQVFERARRILES